jgi:hypothetical protein
MPYKKIVIEKESTWGTAVENTHWHIGNAQQSVHPTAFGVRLRRYIQNLLVSFGEYLIKIGGG